MNKQLPGFARRILIILFWIILWQFAASLIRNHIFLVGPIDTLRALCEQALLPAFWSAILFSFGRICLGFFLLFSPFLPPCFSSISICLSVLSTVSFFFAFTIPHYVLRCGSVDEWHIHSSAEDFRTQRCVCVL